MKATRIVREPDPVPVAAPVVVAAPVPEKAVVRITRKPKEKPRVLPVLKKRKKEKSAYILTAGMIRTRELVFREVCDYLQLDHSTMRDRMSSEYRHYGDLALRECMAVVLCFRYGYSQPETAVVMGLGSHSTINYALRRFYTRPYGGDEGLRLLGIDKSKVKIVMEEEVAA